MPLAHISNQRLEELYLVLVCWSIILGERELDRERDANTKMELVRERERESFAMDTTRALGRHWSNQFGPNHSLGLASQLEVNMSVCLA